MKKHSSRLRHVVTVSAVSAIVVVYLFPIYWLVMTSMKGEGELYESVPTLIVKHPTLESFGRLFTDHEFGDLITNSLLVCSITAVACLALSLTIAYPLARLRFSEKRKIAILNWLLSLRFLPPIAVVVPYFSVIKFVGLYDNILALVIVYTLFNLPLTIWMLYNIMSEIPRDIEEAAFIDGADRLVAFRKIVLPLAVPGILAATVMIFGFSWSEFLFALILTASPDAQTFTVGLNGLVTQFQIIWNEMAAAAVIIILIPLALMVIARKYVIAGLTFGAIREK
jgi:multiple sugar transport system permease protein